MPIGLAYVATRAEQAGHKVKVIDLCFSKNDYKSLGEIIKRNRFEIIGLSIRNLDNVDYYRPKCYLSKTKRLIDTIKSLTDAAIVLGGAGFSIMPLACLRFLGVNLGIKGPGEEAFCALLDSLENRGDLNKVPALVMLKGMSGEGDKDPSTSGPPVEANSSFGPSSLIQWINPAAYFRYGSPISIQAKRGCHFNCVYCSYPSIEGPGYKLRDPLEVAEELGTMARLTGCRNYEIVDSTFNSLEDFAKEICVAIIRQDLKVSLQASGITPATMSRELAELMRRAGFKSVVCSPDSGSEIMLENYQKGFTLSEVEHTASLFRETGFQTLWCYILGGPGESEATLRETFHHAQRWSGPGDAIGLTVGVRIYPGTKMASLASAEGLIKDEDDLWSPKFYLTSNLEKGLFLRQIENEVREHPNYLLAKDAQLPWLPYVRRASTFLGQAFPLWKFAAPINKIRNFLGVRI